MAVGEPIKAKDLKKCTCCGKGVMHTGFPVFYRVTFERMGVDARAVQQAHGMETFFGGNVAIARAFMDPDIAKPLNEPEDLFICEACSLKPQLIAALAERAAEQKERASKKIDISTGDA